MMNWQNYSKGKGRKGKLLKSIFSQIDLKTTAAEKNELYLKSPTDFLTIQPCKFTQRIFLFITGSLESPDTS